MEPQTKKPELAAVAQLATETRMSLAHRRHGRALEKVHSLGRELDSAFEELYASGMEMKNDHGVEVGITLQPPLSEAWFDWRARQQIVDMDARTGVR